MQALPVRSAPTILAIVVTLAALLAPLPAAATKLIARYAFDEESGPVRNDSVGTNTVATESGGSGYLYDYGSVVAGAYGDLTVGDSHLVAAGGLGPGATGAWVTAPNNEFGALTNDFTVMAWVKVTSTDTGLPNRIIGRVLSGEGGGGWSFGVGDGGKLLLTRYGIVDLYTSSTAVTQGDWTHVAVSKSSSTGVTFFVNGVQFENLPAETDNWASSTDPWVLLAIDASDTLQHLVGFADDIRVYQGALDAQGIREALEAPGTLIANYTFGESAGPKRFDFAGTPTDATGAGVSLVYGAPPIPPGTYGSVTLSGNTFGANGGTPNVGNQWLTQPNNELGALTNDFTVMAWVRPDSGNSRARIIGRTGAGTGGWSFGLLEGSPHGFIFTGYGVIDTGTAAAPIQGLTWQHVAATKSSTAGVSFYYNGDLVQQDSGPAANWLPSADAWSLLGSTEEFAGNVDELRVYQGVLDTQSIRDAASGFLCRNPNLAIGGIRKDELVLTDQDLIEDLNLTVDLSYGRVGDMNLILKHVDTGTTASVIITPLAPGGIGTCNGRDLLVTLDDSAATFVSNNCVPTAVPSIKGTFKPSQPLSKFFHEPLAGTWRLQIDDAEGPGTGNLFRWCLQAQKASVPNRIFADAFE